MSAARACCQYHRLSDLGKPLMRPANGFLDDSLRCSEAIEIAEVGDPRSALLRRCAVQLRAYLQCWRRDDESWVCPSCLETCDHDSACELAALLRELPQP